MVMQTGDGAAKQMMADRARLRVLEREQALVDARQESAELTKPEANVSPISAMRHRQG